MILCAGYVATAVLGTGFWAQPVTFPPLALVAKAVSPVLNFMRWCAGESGDVIGSGSLPASFVTWTDLVLSFTMAGVILTLLSNCVTVTRYCLRTPGLGWRGVAQAHAQLLPFLTLLSAIGLWMHVPATKAVQVAHPFAWCVRRFLSQTKSIVVQWNGRWAIGRYTLYLSHPLFLLLVPASLRCLQVHRRGLELCRPDQ